MSQQFRPTARTDSRTGCQPVQSFFAYNDRSEIVSASIGTIAASIIMV